MILGVVLLVAGLVPIAVAGVRFWRNADADDRHTARIVLKLLGVILCGFAVLAGISMIATGGK